MTLAFMFGSCFEMGGSDNEEQTGRQDRGRDPGSHEWERQWDPETGEYVWKYDVEYSDIILSPDGARLIAMVPVPGPRKGYEEPGMVLVAQTLPMGRVEAFPDLRNVERVNFSPDGGTAYALKQGGREVVAIDLDDFTIGQTHMLDDAFSVVDVSPDGRYLVFTNIPINNLQEVLSNNSDCQAPSWYGLPAGADLCEFGVLDLDTGEYTGRALQRPVRDLDFSPVSQELLLTWSPVSMQTTVTFYDAAADDVIKEVTIPNCADELVLQPGGNLALLAPTWCSKDPISILNLDKRTFVTNLPGFGPVELTPDGSTAVGFTRKNAMETQWAYNDQEAPYGLIVVSLPSFDWQVMDYGDVAPTYTISPDGGFLYVYGKSWHPEYSEGEGWTSEWESAFQQVDLSDLTMEEVQGGDIGLSRFVWTPDGEYLFALSHGDLFRLPVGNPVAVKVKLDGSPELINVRPQGDFLLLGEDDAPMFYLLGLESDDAGVTDLDVSL